jgi:hypothetical protein
MRTLTFITALFLATPTLVLAQDDGDDAPAEGADAEGAAEEEPKTPRGTLTDIGVRVPVPEEGWELNVGPKDLSAKNEAGFIVGWTTPYQVPIEEADLEKWSKIYTDKASTESFLEPAVVASSITEVKGRTATSFEISMKTSEDVELTMYAVGFQVPGGNFHLGTIGASTQKEGAKEFLDQLIEGMELTAEPPALDFGGTISVPGKNPTLKADLGDYWRPPVKNEMAVLTRRVQQIGVAGLRGCWVALNPVVADDPDVFVTCKDTNHDFPVVDDLTFADQEAELRDAWIGNEMVGEPIQLGDRLAFWWDTKLGTKQVHVGAVPVEGGLAKVIVRAPNDDAAAASAAKATLQAHQFAAPEPPDLGEQVRYYITYRPTSPLVLGPAAAAVVVLLLILGLIIFGLRRQSQLARAEMEEMDAY